MTHFIVKPLDENIPRDEAMIGLRKLLGTYQEELTIEGLVDSGNAYRVDFEGSAPQLYITLGVEPKQYSIVPLVPLEF